MHINVYIVDNALIPVMYVISHSVIQVHRGDISVYIVGSVRLFVMCVISHLVIQVHIKDIIVYTVVNDHIPDRLCK
jgi:hypothetical protein